MAKQSGIHQIKGKVGEMSYYKQSGVSAGLIRSINSSMSGRVKNDEAYENTRLNNREFAQACKIAAALGRYVEPKYRPMILPFSQSKMAKDVLAIIKADPTANAPWGFRGLSTTNFAIPVDTLNSIAKNNFGDIIADVSHEVEATGSAVNDSIGISFQSGAADKLAAYGATGCYVKACVDFLLYKRPDRQTLSDAEVRGRSFASAEDSVTSYDQDITLETNFTKLPAPTGGAVVGYAVTIIVMPYREVGGVKHILQEACTFQCQQIEA